jgi:hypothetical protein
LSIPFPIQLALWIRLKSAQDIEPTVVIFGLHPMPYNAIGETYVYILKNQLWGD